ncbi:DUF4350 domain-containing protein [Synechocystis salina LEGE 00031]|uniref:DUF4350 domain-containing protein n=2 Tax=Synechocystis TaxID=1142 RepID=A0ABR9VWP2_9SYNC|nr:DUF4350 domain-containing protein [Synechocystis salina LEGE 00041]MBE9255759.1 DUF4350 domain-containing protein [Synechocystis salina LEGE 00031]
MGLGPPLPMLFKSRRNLIILLAIAVVAVGALLWAGTGRADHLQGSTYSTSPGGYGAWWQWMEQRGNPVERWRKPGDELTNLPTPVTLLRIDPRPITNIAPYGDGGNVTPQEWEWVARGNRLVYLGRWAELTEAPFTQTVASDQGPVRIQGRRRSPQKEGKILADEYGTLIWRQRQGRGEIIWVVPPFLAANAFQDDPGNFALLQSLLTEGNNPLWVDEYLHGYKDTETLQKEGLASVWAYLQNTPLMLIFLQSLVAVILLVIFGNRRFGQPQAPPSPTSNNNQAYIHALAQVLEKGDRPQFVVQQLLQAESPSLQRRLGNLPKAKESEATAALLTNLSQPDKLPKNESDLRVWLKQWQQLQAQLPPSS